MHILAAARGEGAVLPACRWRRCRRWGSAHDELKVHARAALVNAALGSLLSLLDCSIAGVRAWWQAYRVGLACLAVKLQ
jgi:hypothetical protein